MRGRRPSIDRAGSEGDDRRCLEAADILWLHYFLEKVMEPFPFLLTVAHFVSQRSRFFNGSRATRFSIFSDLPPPVFCPHRHGTCM